MRTTALAWIPLWFAVCAASAADAPTTTAAAATNQPVPFSATPATARRVDFTSKVNGRPYRLLISVPKAPPPPGGYPVVYLIDGNLHFGIAVETARLQAHWPAIHDPVVVGIAYQTEDEDEALKDRNIDLTPPISPARLRQGWIATMNSKSEEFGQVDAFLDTIEKDVKPRVAALVPVDAADQTLMGHSLGGMTVLHALFTRTSAYRTFVAISPSIWFYKYAVDPDQYRNDEAAFTAAIRAGRANARVLITVGANEAATFKLVDLAPKVPQDVADAMMRDCRMVENVQELGARLEKIAGPHLTSSTVVFADENHNSGVPAGISRGIRFAMHR